VLRDVSRWYVETRAAALRYAAERGLSPELAEEFADGVLVDRARGRLEPAHLDWRIKELKRRELGRQRGYGNAFGDREAGFDEPVIVERRRAPGPDEPACPSECASDTIGGSLEPACTVPCAPEPAAPTPASTAQPRLDREEADWLKAVRASAIGFGISRGLKPELAEEFAQEVVVDRALGSGSATYRLDWRLTDFLRRELGSTRGNNRSLKGRARAAARHLCLDEPVSRSDGRLLVETIAATAPDPHAPGSGWRDRVQLTPRQQLLAELRFDDGMLEAEIADLFRVSESRISQLLAPILRKIADAAILDERLEEYRLFPERSQLLVRWITL